MSGTNRNLPTSAKHDLKRAVIANRTQCADATPGRMREWNQRTENQACILGILASVELVFQEADPGIMEGCAV